jgi:tetratricopeptide (TPR) repeat protein
MAVSKLCKGKQLEEEGKLEEALACYRQVLVRDSNNSWAYHHMGEVLAKLDQFHEAVTVYRHAIELKPDFSWSYHHLGDALTQQQQWEEASTAFDQAIDLNPEHYGSYVGLGKSLAKLDRFEEAIAAYRRAKELNPDADWINFLLAEVLEQKKQSDLAVAIANCQRAIELNPADLQAYYKFLELQPDNCNVWLQLADTLADRDRLEEAIVVYRQVVQLIELGNQTTSNFNSKMDRESIQYHFQ